MRNLNTTANAMTSALAIRLALDTDAPASGGDTAAPDSPEAPKADDAPKTVLSHMKSRATFDSADDALAYLERMATECTDFGDYPGLTVGMTDDGAFDPEVYTDAMLVTVARLTEKGSKEKGTETRVIAIVVYPTPKTSAVIESPEGLAWVGALIEKEANLVAMRALRRDDDLAAGVDAMPKTLADYWTPATTSGGTLAAYNDLWQAVRDATGAKIPALKQAGLSKKQFRFSLESASFAADSYPRLESRKNKAGQEYSAFVYALHIGIALAKEEGLDSSFFENCLKGRDDKVIEITDTGEDDVELDFLTGEEDGDGEEGTEA